MDILLKLFIVFAYGGLVIWWWVTWLGMHNNTLDGNTFRLAMPFAILDKSQFNEKGNAWRKQHIICDVLGFALTGIIWIYSRFTQYAANGEAKGLAKEQQHPRSLALLF